MISTYDELIAEVSTHTKRPDKVTRVPVYIRLAEAMFDRVLRLRINEAYWHTNLGTDDRRCPLPPGYQNMRTLRLIVNQHYRDLISCSPESLKIYPCKGVPSFFCVGGDIEFDVIPCDNFEIEMKYFKKIENLSESNQTNKVLENHPDLYLYMAISQLHLDARDEEPAAYYKSLADNVIMQADIANNSSSHGAAPAAVTEDPTP